MNWVFLQMSAMTIAAMNGVLDEWLTHLKLGNPRLFLASSGLVSLPIVAIGITQVPMAADAILPGLASGLCFSGAVLLYYRAIAHESVVRLALPGRLLAMLSLPLNAILLSQPLSGKQLIAFGLMSVSGWLLTQEGGQSRTCLTRGFWLMVSVEALYLCQDCLKNILTTHYDAATMLTWERAGILLGTVLALFQGRGWQELKEALSTLPGQLRLLLVGRQVAHLLMGLLFGLAIQTAPAATQVVLMGGVYPLVILAVSRAVLGRRSSPAQRWPIPTGVFCTVLAVGLVVL